MTDPILPTAHEAAVMPDNDARRDRSAGLRPHARQLLQRASVALQRQDLRSAREPLDALTALAPNHPEVLRLHGVALFLAKRYTDSAAVLRRALELWPDDSLAHNNLGSALGEAGDIEGSLAALRRSVELTPHIAAVWFNLGHALDLSGRIDEAHDVLRKALEIDPDHVDARVSLGRTLQMLGKIDESEENFRRAVKTRPDSARAWYGLSTLRTARFDAADTELIERVHMRPGAPAEARILSGFALGKAYEDQDRFAEAFTILTSANAMKRRQLEWNAANFSRSITATINAFPAPTVRDSAATRGSEVIFVISLPRSGSTLVEHILAAHPQVEGANELTDLQDVLQDECARRNSTFPVWAARANEADWERLGNDYLQRTSRWRTQQRISTDKGLSNWHYVGAAQAMLPGARFVNCRRDPLETSLACFRQLFGHGQAYTYDLVETAALLRDYNRLMQHWHELSPGKMHELVYENLVTDSEVQIRRLLDVCGLPFDPACLTFHESERTVRTASAAQVREPLRQDTARAARYGKLLDPLRRALHAPK